MTRQGLGAPLLLLAALVCLPASSAAAADVPEWAHVSRKQILAAEKLGVPVAFENDLGMRFVLIPAGTFPMGVPKKGPAPPYRAPWRSPPHTVSLTRAYYLQTTEMTVGQVKALTTKRERKVLTKTLSRDRREPAVGLSHAYATELLKRLSKEDPARVYRLPTDAEWERALRGGKSGTYYWGKNPAKARDYEVLAAAKDKPAPIAHVASRKPNPFGLYDMLGNVCELTQDRMAPLAKGRVVDPVGPVALHREVAPLFGYRVLRGGSHKGELAPWMSWARLKQQEGYIGWSVGLRVVSPLEPDGTEGGGFSCPLIVRTVRAEDGVDLPAPWSRIIQRDLLDEIKEQEEAKGGRLLLALDPSGRLDARVQVTPPKGRATWTGLSALDTRIAGRVPRRTRRIELVAPLHPTLRVVGNLEVPEDTEAQFCSAWLRGYGALALEHDHPGHFSRRVTTPRKDGRFTLTDIPWMPGVPIVIESKHGMGRLGGAPAWLPKLWAPSYVIRHVVKVGYRRQGVYVSRWLEAWKARGRKKTQKKGGPPKAGAEPFKHEGATTYGSARLTCVSADRVPLPGAIVVRSAVRNAQGYVVGAADCAIADAKGRAVFPEVPPGQHDFEVFEEARLPGKTRLAVAEGEQAEAELRTDRPARLELTLTRGEGGPARWAEVRLLLEGAREWVNLDPEGVLRPLARTDHTGAVTLYNIPGGRHTVRALWLGRGVQQVVTIRSGQRLKLALELPKVEGWKPK